jgi:hypothetical protein
MAKSKKDVEEGNAPKNKDVPNAYGRYSASDQVGANEFKNRGTRNGRDRSQRGDRSNEVPGAKEGPRVGKPSP